MPEPTSRRGDHRRTGAGGHGPRRGEATSETPGGPSRHPDRSGSPAACGPTPGTTCAATRSSSSRRWSSSSWCHLDLGPALFTSHRPRSTATWPRPRRAPQPGTRSASTARAATSTPAWSTAPGPPSTVGVCATLGVVDPRRPPRRPRRLLRRLVGLGPLPDHRHLLRHPGAPRRPGLPAAVVTSNTVWPVIGFIVLLGWPQISRIARGSVITAEAERLRPGGPRARRLQLPDPAPPHPAQRHRPGHRRRDHRARHVHRARGDAVVPRRRAQPPTVSWGMRHLDGQSALRPQRPAHAAVPVGAPGDHRARVHHARRRGPRRPRPEAAVTLP